MCYASDGIWESTKFVIYDQKTNKYKQSINLPEDMLNVNDTEFDDFNFDGYKDIYIIQSNNSKLFWICLFIQ